MAITLLSYLWMFEGKRIQREMRKKRGVSVFFPVVQRKINIIMQL